MKLAIVVGQIVSTVKLPDVGQERMLLVDVLDKKGLPEGERLVAVDPIGAGDGEWVLIVSGSTARRAVRTANNTDSPIDASVIGIVDEAVVNGKVFYHKGDIQ